MAKGTVAKQIITEALKQSFGDDFIGEFDKKVYLWVDDENNERVQIAISMTCPKTPVGDENDPRGRKMVAGSSADNISNEEVERMEKLIEMFNL